MAWKYLVGAIFITAVVLGASYGPGVCHWWQSPPKPKPTLIPESGSLMSALLPDWSATVSNLFLGS